MDLRQMLLRDFKKKLPISGGFGQSVEEPIVITTSDRAGLSKLDSPISDKKSLVFLAQSAQVSNDETTQKKSHGRFQGQGSFSSAARG